MLMIIIICILHFIDTYTCIQSRGATGGGGGGAGAIALPPMIFVFVFFFFFLACQLSGQSCMPMHDDNTPTPLR